MHAILKPRRGLSTHDPKRSVLKLLRTAFGNDEVTLSVTRCAGGARKEGCVTGKLRLVFKGEGGGWAGIGAFFCGGF